MSTEAARRVDFSTIRYAQVWEDAEVLLGGLEVGPPDVCLSIASAGDNALSLLTRAPRKVVAVDVNPAQLACLELRVAAIRGLDHGACLELLGLRPSPPAPEARRMDLYQQIRRNLPESARTYWDAHPDFIRRGAATVGKFERYFELFRSRVLPWIHSGQTVAQLLAGGTAAERRRFYAERWNTWRWRLLFRLFFSRGVMGRLGRDPAFFRYVDGPVATRILERTQFALTALDPAENPYLHWILTGHHGPVLPHPWRPENFARIRANLERLELRLGSVEEVLAAHPGRDFTRFNLSDIGEYMSEDAFRALLEAICAKAVPGARLAYWNMLAARHRPESMAARLRRLTDQAEAWHARDRAFFYRAFVLEEVMG